MNWKVQRRGGVGGAALVGLLLLGGRAWASSEGGLEGDCALGALGHTDGDPEVRALVSAFGVTDASALLPWSAGLSVGRSLEGRVEALTFYGAQPDDSYGVQHPAAVRYPGRPPLGLSFADTPAQAEARLGPPAMRTEVELGWERGPLSVRLAFVNGRLDVVRVLALGPTPADAGCALPPGEVAVPASVREALAATPASPAEGNCLLALLGAPLDSPPVQAQLAGLGKPERVERRRADGAGAVELRWPARGLSLETAGGAAPRIVALRLVLRARQGVAAFAGQLPLGLPREGPAKLAARLEPVLYPPTQAVRYLAPAGVRAVVDTASGELLLQSRDPARSYAAPPACHGG